MADPLSVSASISGLVMAAVLIAQRIYKYVKAVKESKDDIQALSSEVTTLSGILKSLQLAAEELERQEYETSTRVHNVFYCQQTLDKLSAHLKKHEPADPNKDELSLSQKLRWPFTKSETKGLVAEVKRHQDTLKLALNADSITMLLRSLSLQDGTEKEIRAIRSELQHHIQAVARVHLDDQRLKTLEFFSHIDHRVNHQMSLKLRQAGTGIWLTEATEFKSWLRTPNTSLWYYGIPGAGKTILAATIIEECLRHSEAANAVAYFYCDYKDPRSHLPLAVLGSLLKQLGRQNEDALELLQTFQKRHDPSKQTTPLYDATDLRDLLATGSGTFDNITIVVDGLDECGEHTEDVVELLESLGKHSLTIKSAFLSRDHQEIRDAFPGIVRISIAVQSADLRLSCNRKSNAARSEGLYVTRMLL